MYFGILFFCEFSNIYAEFFQKLPILAKTCSFSQPTSLYGETRNTPCVKTTIGLTSRG